MCNFADSRNNRRGDGSSARMTQKREMENYIHSQVVQELFNIQIEIDDTMDVSTEISNIIRAANPEGFSPHLRITFAICDVAETF